MSYLDKTGLTRLWAQIVSRLGEKIDKTTTVNGKALSSNITLSASDVGADASGTAQNTATVALMQAKAYTDNKIPKITYSTTDLEAGVSELAEGEVYFVYE